MSKSLLKRGCVNINIHLLPLPSPKLGAWNYLVYPIVVLCTVLYSAHGAEGAPHTVAQHGLVLPLFAQPRFPSLLSSLCPFPDPQFWCC